MSTATIEQPLDLEGQGLLRELAALDIEVDGIEALHQLVAEILGQISTQDAWAGRAPALDAPHACGACGRWQRVRVPFLHHACDSCKSLWVPGHCSRCGRTAATLLSDFDASHPPICTCGHELDRLGVIPQQRPVGAPVAPPEPVAFTETTTRRASLTVKLSGAAAAIVALVAAVAIVSGQGTPDAGHAPLPAARPQHAAAAVTPTERGNAMGAQLRADGLPTNPFACAAALNSNTKSTGQPPLTGSDLTAYVTACAH